MKRLSWKYLAGLIDGEGCIDVQINTVRSGVYVRPRVRVVMADVAIDILEMCHNSYGGYLFSRKGKGTFQDSTAWEVCGYKNSCTLLRNLVNHLILKKEQARFCLWMEQNIKGKHVSTEVRDAIREELKLMKRDAHRLSDQAQKRISGML